MKISAQSLEAWIKNIRAIGIPKILEKKMDLGHGPLVLYDGL